jgi:glutamyl-tRNA synthetase
MGVCVETRSATRAQYRGRLAPSPTGYLHLGHARTFWTGQERALMHRGTLVLRNEDLDHARCRPQFVTAMLEDLRWFGFVWHEGPDRDGPFGPYSQSKRRSFYVAAFDRLRDAGFVYPCTCSRQDVLRSLQAPHAGEDEPVYPGTCRPRTASRLQVNPRKRAEVLTEPAASGTASPAKVNWRFRVPDGEVISFIDGYYGPQQFVAGRDFGDFVIWRHDDVPAYQLAVVVDDEAMKITEVVRGEDLLRSTARQLLLYRALGWTAPGFYHCPLLKDELGVRLAKRNDALSLRCLRRREFSPEQLRENWAPPTR